MAKKGGLNTPMTNMGGSLTQEPVVKGARTKGYCAPFDLPHSKGPATIPVVFEQGNLVGEGPAEILNSPMQSNAVPKTKKS